MFNLQPLLELLNYLFETYFVRGTKDLLNVSFKLELSLKRYYVINCIMKGNNKKLKVFFQHCGEEICSNSEWTDWFNLAYVKKTHSLIRYLKTFLLEFG